MVDATLSRGSTSVSIPLLDSGGAPVIGVDHGKPNLEIQRTGSLNPRHIDQYSGLESYTLLGRFTSSTAYQDVITLADLIKSNSNGNDLELSIPLPEFNNPMIVAPAAGQQEAVSLEYLPGRRDWVDVDIGLTRVNQTLGGGDQPATTPTASGTGPIELSYQGTSVALDREVTVSRAVGRPQSTVRRSSSSTHPNYYDKFKTAHDAFELAFETGPGNLSKITDLVSMFNTQLGRKSLTLNFNGLYGMGSMNVVPAGSGALRHLRPAGEQGTKLVPKISLRRVI